MGNAIIDYMSNWLNTTYGYLKETGGPTYPVKKATTGPGVLPGGGYSLVEDYPPTYDVPITRYPTPLPFNPNNMGLPAIVPNENRTNEELVKEDPTPTVISSNFQRLYAGMMKACIDDQKHRHGNLNAASACHEFAESGDPTNMVFGPNQKLAIGLTGEPAKPLDVQLAENEASLTGQISGGIKEIGNVWGGFAGGLGQPLVKDPSGNKTLAGSPLGSNFQSLSDRLKGFVPGMPEIPGVNTGSIVMIGGAVVLIVLLIAIVK